MKWLDIVYTSAVPPCCFVCSMQSLSHRLRVYYLGPLCAEYLRAWWMGACFSCCVQSVNFVCPCQQSAFVVQVSDSFAACLSLRHISSAMHFLNVCSYLFHSMQQIACCPSWKITSLRFSVEYNIEWVDCTESSASRWHSPITKYMGNGIFFYMCHCMHRQC